MLTYIEKAKENSKRNKKCSPHDCSIINDFSSLEYRNTAVGHPQVVVYRHFSIARRVHVSWLDSQSDFLPTRRLARTVELVSDNESCKKTVQVQVEFGIASAKTRTGICRLREDSYVCDFLRGLVSLSRQLHYQREGILIQPTNNLYHRP